MRVNSKKCKMGNCSLYPCKREKCDNSLAFDDNGNWFIAKPKRALELNLWLKRSMFNEQPGVKKDLIRR